MMVIVPTLFKFKFANLNAALLLSFCRSTQLTERQFLLIEDL